MQLGDFLNTLAGKLNLQQNEQFKSLIANDAIVNAQIDDELAGLFDTGLLSLQAAKNNTEIQNAYKPILLKKIDEQFAEFAKEYGFEAENASEKSTYNRAALLKSAFAKKIAELEKGAGHAEATKEIARLQAELQKLTTAKEQEVAQLKAEQAQQILNALVDLELHGKSYANKELGDTNYVIARTILDQALKTDKVALVNDNGKIVLKQAENTSLDYYDASHKQVGFSDYVTKTLADKKLLAVSQETEPSQRVDPIIPPSTGGQKVDTSKFAAAASASMADLQ